MPLSKFSLLLPTPTAPIDLILKQPSNQVSHDDEREDRELQLTSSKTPTEVLRDMSLQPPVHVPGKRKSEEELRKPEIDMAARQEGFEIQRILKGLTPKPKNTWVVKIPRQRSLRSYCCVCEAFTSIVETDAKAKGKVKSKSTSESRDGGLCAICGHERDVFCLRRGTMERESE